MSTRRFQLGFCGDWVEIYEQIPRPKNQGEFFLAFRKRRARKVLPLLCGITAGGVKVMVDDFRARRYDPTELVLLIGRKLNDKCAEFVSLSAAA